jgi:CBS domain-containing protein
LFFVSIFKGLPILQEYIGKRFYKKPLGVEEQTRSLMALLIFVVFIGSLLHLHPIVCAFLVGISLANVHIHRRVLHNINFVTFNIFVPIVFIVIGAEMNLSIFKEHQNYLYPIVLCLSLIFIRVTCSFIVARLSKFSLKKSMGFGFVSVPQLTGPLAMTIGAKQYGFISDTLFNSIIILSIVTTFIGPLLTKFLLFPGLRHRKKGFISLDEFLHLDIKPIPALTPLSTILSMVKDTELPVYPVIDENDAYMGVIHLEDVKNIVFGEELDRLVIATDVLDKNYPFICREILIEDAISLFKQPGILAIPVIEDCGKEKIYLGIILLKDILSFYS